MIKSTLAFLLAILAGSITVHYTLKLRNDPYTRYYQVAFRRVSGLDTKSGVFAMGVRVGRVSQIDLDEENSRVVVTLKVLPNFSICKKTLTTSDKRFEGQDHYSRLEVVAANAFGKQQIEIEPGIPRSDADLASPDEILEGLRPSVSALLERLKARDPAIPEAFDEVVLLTRDLNNPDTGFGRLSADSDIARSLGESAESLRGTSDGFAEAARAIEGGETGIGQLLDADAEARERFRDSLVGLREGIASLLDTARSLRPGESGLANMIHDPASEEGLSQSLDAIEKSASEATEENSFWRNDDVLSQIRQAANDFATGSKNLNGEEGFAARFVRDKTAAKDLREVLRDLREQSVQIRQGEGPAANLLTNPDNSDQLRELLQRLRIFSRDSQDAIHRGVAGQAVNTVHGAVFSIF